MWDWPTYAIPALIRNCTSWSIDFKSERWLETSSQLKKNTRERHFWGHAQLVGVGVDVANDLQTQKFNCKIIRVVPIQHQLWRSIERHDRLRWFQRVFWSRPARNLRNYLNRTNRIQSLISVTDPLISLARCTERADVTRHL